jgi:flavine halogenase
VALGHDNNAWNVVSAMNPSFPFIVFKLIDQIRSEFDQILLNHARSCNAKVYEQTRAVSIEFLPTDFTKPGSVNWSSTVSTGFAKKEPSTGMTTFDYLIDASGRAGIMSNTYLKNRYVLLVHVRSLILQPGSNIKAL